MGRSQGRGTNQTWDPEGKGHEAEAKGSPQRT